MSVEKNTPHILRHEKPIYTTILNDEINRFKNATTLGIYCYIQSRPRNADTSTIEIANHFELNEEIVQEHLKTILKIQRGDN